MRRLICTAIFLFLVTAALGLPASVSAQNSIGYSEPQNVSRLLEYRLPDWSYRIWDADFDLSGWGSDSRSSGEQASSHQFDTQFGSRFAQTWESEKRHLLVNGDLAGTYSHYHSGDAESEESNHRLTGGVSLGGRINHYLGEGPFSVLTLGQAGRGYTEDISEYRFYDTWDEAGYVRRRSSYSAGVGVAWGRVRNVVPLLRAERLSERLVAMGRLPLTAGQIQAMAEVLAKEFAYRKVFDRFDRQFWEDVLAPMLDEGNPLTPYEILYLVDVLNEDLGNRRQGFEVSAQYRYGESNTFGGTTDYQSRFRRPELEAVWYRNLSLAQQVRVTCLLGYRWENFGSGTSEAGSGFFTAGHLWNLADRYRLDTTLGYFVENRIESDRGTHLVRFTSAFNVFLEDQVSLIASLGIDYEWDHIRNDEEFRWDWVYRLGLTYHLDRALF